MAEPIELTSLPRGARLPASLQTAAMVFAPERYLRTAGDASATTSRYAPDRQSVPAA
jgi:hypothetical protein